MLHLFGVVSKAVVLSNFRAQSNVESLAPFENGIFIIKKNTGVFILKLFLKSMVSYHVDFNL